MPHMTPDEIQQQIRGRRALITGGAGFIGSNLAHRLVELDVRVTIVDNLSPDHGSNLRNLNGVLNHVEFVTGDVCQPEAINKLVADQDMIFSYAGQVSHLASLKTPAGDLYANLQTHMSVLTACLHFNPGARVVYAGTRGQYGRPASYPVSEDAPLEPVDPNGVNKTAAEMYSRLYHRVHGMETVVLRLTNTFGPRQCIGRAGQGFIGHFFRRAIEGMTLSVFGTGDQLRDFNYVDDVVDASILAAVHPAAVGEVFNVGSGVGRSVKAVAECVARQRPGVKIEHVPYPPGSESIEIGSYVADIAKIQHTIGWTPQADFDESVAATLAFFEEHKEHYW